MTQLPNIISLLRIAGSLGLLLCDVTGVMFWIIYALCGISDIADGWLARKLKCVTRTGVRRLRLGGISCIHDFRWLQFISSLVSAIIAWCYWPGIKERTTVTQ